MTRRSNGAPTRWAWRWAWLWAPIVLGVAAGAALSWREYAPAIGYSPF